MMKMETIFLDPIIVSTTPMLQPTRMSAMNMFLLGLAVDTPTKNTLVPKLECACRCVERSFSGSGQTTRKAGRCLTAAVSARQGSGAIGGD